VYRARHFRSTRRRNRHRLLRNYDYNVHNDYGAAYYDQHDYDHNDQYDYNDYGGADVRYV
jgi:hypothetical protein